MSLLEKMLLLSQKPGADKHAKRIRNSEKAASKKKSKRS